MAMFVVVADIFCVSRQLDEDGNDHRRFSAYVSISCY